MKPIKFILSKIKRLLLRLMYSKEELYYKQLFVHNPQWNSVTLNDDQLLRWSAIEDLIKNKVAPSKHSLILDVGCGNCWMTNLLSDYGIVTGIEPLASVVKYGRKLYPGLRLLVADLPTFRKNFPNETFDLIVSSEVIEHIPDYKKKDFVSNMRATVSSGGYAIITTPRKEVLAQLGGNPSQPIEDWLYEEELKQIFEANHFEALECKRLIPADPGNLEIYQVWLFKSN